MRKVLIVEDEWLIGESLKDLLIGLGYEVLGPAPSCSMALEIISANRPDIALVDLHLGTETCEAVLDDCAAKGVKVVLISATAAEDLPEFCAGLLALGKPFGDDEVAAALIAA